jgi:hypothetical protein
MAAIARRPPIIRNATATRMSVVVFVRSISLLPELCPRTSARIKSFLHPYNDKKINAILIAGKTPPLGGVSAFWMEMLKSGFVHPFSIV